LLREDLRDQGRLREDLRDQGRLREDLSEKSRLKGLSSGIDAVRMSLHSQVYR